MAYAVCPVAASVRSANTEYARYLCHTGDVFAAVVGRQQRVFCFFIPYRDSLPLPRLSPACLPGRARFRCAARSRAFDAWAVARDYNDRGCSAAGGGICSCRSVWLIRQQWRRATYKTSLIRLSGHLLSAGRRHTHTSPTYVALPLFSVSAWTASRHSRVYRVIS